MFNCLPGAMLHKGHTHQCQKGFSCSRVPSQHNPRTTASHRLFNPGRTVAKLHPDFLGVWARAQFYGTGVMHPSGFRGSITKHLATARDRWRLNAVIPKSRALTNRLSCFADAFLGLGYSPPADRTRACADH